MLEIVFFPIVLLMSFPGLALVPGCIFLIIYKKRKEKISGSKRKLVLLAMAIWISYGVYETCMYFWMKTVIAPIRIDLLLIAPVLYVITIIGIMACVPINRNPLNLNNE